MPRTMNKISLAVCDDCGTWASDVQKCPECLQEMQLVEFMDRRYWNAVVHSVIVDQMENGVVTSPQAHSILGAWNRQCWPELYRLCEPEKS